MTRKLTALVIGNGNYPGAVLANPANDASDFSSSLMSLGFSIVKIIDSTLEGIDRAVESFKDSLNNNDVGLFYFAGHGMQIDGENFLAAIDTKFKDEISARHSSYSLNKLIAIMDKCSNNTNLIILDACRNNPYIRGWKRGANDTGLAPVFTPKGTLIAYATSPGETAADGAGRNGSYTEALLRHINTPDVSIEDVFKRTRNTLSVITSGRQTSWEHTSLTGDFVFNISVGRKITAYSPEALADARYSTSKAGPAGRVLEGLRSHNWNRQNDVIDLLDVSLLASCDNDALFVLGRNILQAADGNARRSISYIKRFRGETAGLESAKIKSLLDGILFEIFFNSKAELRAKFKSDYFINVFDLNEYPEFSGSFEFISEILLGYQSRFYIVPGKKRGGAVDVETKWADTALRVSGVYYEGFDILKPSDDPFAAVSGGKPQLVNILVSDLKDRICKQMMVPAAHLDIKFISDVTSPFLLWPEHYSVAK